MVRVVGLTDEAYADAVMASARIELAPTAVVLASVHSLQATSSLGLSLELRNGASVTIPVCEIAELKDKPRASLERVEVDPAGEGLLWRELDIGISTQGLLRDFFGYATRAKIARAGGRSSSPAKAAAARANGKKGGRKRTTA